MTEQFRARRSAGCLILSGPLDEVSVDSLREVLARYDSGGRLLVDLRRVTYLASCAVSALVTTALRFRDRGELLLVAEAGSPAQQVLDVCGVPHEVVASDPTERSRTPETAVNGS